MDNDVTIIVSSYDGYRYAWTPFCHGLNKYWPNPPWPVRIVTNHLDPPCGQALKIGDDHGWTHATRTALRAVGTPVVLWMHEDAWLAAPPDTQAMLDWADIILKGEADYIRLTITANELGYEAYPGDPRLCIVPTKFEYRASLRPALWRVKTFLSLLRDGESVWSFEIEASKRAWDDNERFLCAKDTLAWQFPHHSDPSWQGYQTPISRGVWTSAAKEYARREGIEIDFSRQPKEG